METIQIPELSSTYLTDKMEQLKQEYPAYHRVWKSMITTYGTHEVCVDWKGTIGFMKFIEDSSILANSPSNLPDFAHTVKLKRLDTNAVYSPSNVAWVLTKASERVLKLRGVRSLQKMQHSLKTPLAVPLAVPLVSAIETMSRDEQETKFDTLMMRQFSGEKLSALEETEMTILGNILASSVPTVHTPKHEDI